MTDRSWRIHLLLLGWAAVLVAASFAARPYWHQPAERFYLQGGLRVDRWTGEIRRLDSSAPGGAILMQAYATPTPWRALESALAATPVPADPWWMRPDAPRIIDDLDDTPVAGGALIIDDFEATQTAPAQTASPQRTPDNFEATSEGTPPGK